MELIPHRLTPDLSLDGIRSLIGFGTADAALVHSVLYLRQETVEASPKAISGRTSYNRV